MLDLKAQLELLDPLVIRDHKEILETKEFKEIEVTREVKDQLDQQVLLAQLDLQAHKDKKD